MIIIFKARELWRFDIKLSSENVSSFRSCIHCNYSYLFILELLIFFRVSNTWASCFSRLAVTLISLLARPCPVRVTSLGLPLLSSSLLHVYRSIWFQILLLVLILPFLGAFAKLRKATQIHVRPSVRVEQLCSLWTDFDES